MIDIIIPVLNEEQILNVKREYYLRLKQAARIIFVDGGSDDQTTRLAEEYGEVIICPPGRGKQKNFGASYSCADGLLFLHVDSSIDPGTLTKIEHALHSGIVGGCLTMCIDDRRWMFRVYEAVVNFRAKKFGVVDGDLGQFVKRDVFESIGGFGIVPIMEDLLFSKKLRQHDRIVVLNHPICVSARRWYQEGFFKTFGRYTLAYIQLWTKIPFFKDPLCLHKLAQKQPS